MTGNHSHPAPYVVVVGGANVDILGFPHNRLTLRDSNPGHVKLAWGGVGRNIAENICRLGIKCFLITILGRDFYARQIIEHGRLIGLEILTPQLPPDAITSSYIALHDETGDMAVALACMDAYDNFPAGFILDHRDLIAGAACLVVDGNIPAPILTLIFDLYRGPVYYDPVSTAKAEKARAVLGRFHCIKPNRHEAEALSGLRIADDGDLAAAASHFLELGVNRVFLTLDRHGLFFADRQQSRRLVLPPPEVVNATGAGDAFVAGLVVSHLHQLNLCDTAAFATACSVCALRHFETINPSLSFELVAQTLEELNEHLRILPAE
ncbi:MAG: carbohydrate kinase family protein [Negativicutes bacterium]|nr:carbohydrate kinase family protein [Negativicutes bacterium]